MYPKSVGVQCTSCKYMCDTLHRNIGKHVQIQNYKTANIPQRYWQAYVQIHNTYDYMHTAQQAHVQLHIHINI